MLIKPVSDNPNDTDANSVPLNEIDKTLDKKEIINAIEQKGFKVLSLEETI